jgi:hypothetical protein
MWKTRRVECAGAAAQPADGRPLGGRGSPMEQPQSIVKVGPDPPWGVGVHWTGAVLLWGEQAQPMRDWTVKVDVRVKRPPCWRPLSLDGLRHGAAPGGDDRVMVVPTNPAVVPGQQTPKF